MKNKLTILRVGLMLTYFILLFPGTIRAQSWEVITPNGGSPSERWGHTAVYDATNNRMTIFGGLNNVGNYLNDVWVLSTANGLNGIPTWTQISTQGSTPIGRSLPSAVYDSTNNLMIIFGGFNSTTFFCYNDVWVLSTANGLGGTSAWTQLSTVGSNPTTRLGHTAIYDSSNNRMTIFGGGNGTLYLNDVWVLSHANGLGGTPSWTQITTSGSSPTTRFESSAVYDTTNNRMIIFGGGFYNGTSYYLNDVWVLSNANGLGGTPTWSQITIAGNAPSPREGHSAIYDTVNNRMIIFGGYSWSYPNYYAFYNDVWVLSHANGLGGTPTWTQLSPNPDPINGDPATRELHTAVYDATNNRMIIFGGGNENTLCNDVWVLNYANGIFLPALTMVPSLKLFVNQSFNPAFDLSDYNTGGVATTYLIDSNFLTLSTLTGSTVYQAPYGMATVGTNIYEADNVFGSSIANNQVKYSSYKIYKLPHVGLSVGNSWDVNIASYTYDSSGLALPPSFGNMDALSTDNPAITATWLNNSTVQITATATIASVANVYVTASPNATFPYGGDVDMERIQVYTNLLSHSTFSTANDIAPSVWGALEHAPGRANLPTFQQWLASYTDTAGTQATGVWQFYFADSTQGVKATINNPYWIPITTGQWYTFRIRLVADSTNNSHQALLFGFTNDPNNGQTDIVGNVLFGVPTVWTWQEAPLLAHGSTTTGYPQFQFKAGGPGSIYVDEIQIINAVPALMEARSNPQFHYQYGQFTSANDTTGWGQELYPGVERYPLGFTVNDGLVIAFESPPNPPSGFKWTANNGVQEPGNAYGFPTPNLNHDINAGLTLTVPIGGNGVSILLVAAFGIQTAGQQDIGIPPSNLIAVAGIGPSVSGNYYAEGIAINPYYQLQFGAESNSGTTIAINNVDIATDKDDPNFGDPTLFP